MDFNWPPISGGGGGGSSDSFSIIQTPSGTSPTATTPTSVLDLKTANAYLSITGNSVDDSVTFQVSPPVVSASNVGTGDGQVFKALSTADLKFKTIKAGTNITVTNNVDDITLAATAPVQSVANVGTGGGLVYKTLSGTAAQLKSIKAGTGITVTNNTDDITIDNAGLSISGTDKAIARLNGTTGLQGSGVFVADVASGATSIYTASSNSLTISTDGAKTSAGGTSGWLDLYTTARMRFLHASYSPTIGAVEWSNLRTFNRVPICFDGSYGIGKRTDGTLERPTDVFVSNYVGVDTGGTPPTSAGIEIGGTTKAMLFPRMTTTQRDALTAVNGMVIYNSSTDKLQVRAAGAWVDLH